MTTFTSIPRYPRLPTAESDPTMSDTLAPAIDDVEAPEFETPANTEDLEPVRLPVPEALLDQLIETLLYSPEPVIVPVRAAHLIAEDDGRLWVDLYPTIDPAQDAAEGAVYDSSLVIGQGRIVAVIPATSAHLIVRGAHTEAGRPQPLARLEVMAGYRPTTSYNDVLEELWRTSPGDRQESLAEATTNNGLPKEVLSPPSVRDLLSAGRVARFHVEASTVTIDAEGRGWLEDQLVPVAVPQMLGLGEERRVFVEIAEIAPYLRVRVPATESWLVTNGEASRRAIGINRLVMEGDAGAPDVVTETGAAGTTVTATPKLLDDPEAPQSWWAKLSRLVGAR